MHRHGAVAHAALASWGKLLGIQGRSLVRGRVSFLPNADSQNPAHSTDELDLVSIPRGALNRYVKAVNFDNRSARCAFRLQSDSPSVRIFSRYLRYDFHTWRECGSFVLPFANGF